jgi:hypothetical protein
MRSVGSPAPFSTALKTLRTFRPSSRAGARQRERSAKNRAARRTKWLAQHWKGSEKGNLWLHTQGNRVIIRRKGTAWTFTVARNNAPPHHEAATFPTADQAKLAAFDFIWPAVAHVM